MPTWVALPEPFCPHRKGRSWSRNDRELYYASWRGQKVALPESGEDLMSLPISRRLVFVALVLLGLSALGCRGTRNMIPPDVSVGPSDQVRIAAGTGVDFTGFDGEPVNATGLIAAPGPHEIDFKVRRNLRTESDYLDGVFHRAECTLSLDAVPGGQYLVKFETQRETVRWRGGAAPVGSTMHNYDTFAVVIDNRTEEARHIPCEFYHDCRHLKEGVTRASYCRDYRVEDGIGD